MTDRVDLKTMGKLGEELGECVAAVGRCMVQGVGEWNDKEGSTNRDWLEKEIADVQANIFLVVSRFNLDRDRINARIDAKIPKLREWHGMA